MSENIWFSFVMLALGGLIIIGLIGLGSAAAKNPGPRYEIHCLNGVQYWTLKGAASRSALALAFNRHGDLLLCEGK